MTIQPPARGTKGSVLRGVVKALEQAGMLAAVSARVSPRARALLQEPPPVSSWLDPDLTDEINAAIDAVGGARACRSILREGAKLSHAQLMQSFLNGLLRMFGVSPHTIFQRINEASSLVSRGVEYEYEKLSPQSARVVVRIPSKDAVPNYDWQITAGGLESVFDICGVEGTISEPVVAASGPRNRATFTATWLASAKR